MPPSPLILVIGVARAVDWDTPYRMVGKVAKPLESRVHFGKDEDTPSSAAAKPAQVEQLNPALDRRAAGRRRPRRRPSSTPARHWPRSRRIAGALGIGLRQDDPDGVALTFDDGPHPQGTPAVLEALREAGAAGDLLPRRRAGRARALRWRRRSSPPATASSCTAIRHRNQLRLTPRLLLDDAERGGRRSSRRRAGRSTVYRPPYGIFSGGGLRAIRRRGWRPLLWSLWGRDWDRRAMPSRSRADPRPARRRATSCSSTTPTSTARRAHGPAQRRRCR